MALTRAQLLAGNSSQGVVLPGQVQGVRQGVGVAIAVDGTISFDSVTATGIIKTNNASAYNNYVWPTLAAAPDSGSIITTDGSGNILWTSNYVTTTGAIGAAKLPSGATADRPVAPLAGDIRYNTELDVLEYYDGTNWSTVVAVDPTPGPGSPFGYGLVVEGTAVKAATLITNPSPAVGTLPSEATEGSLYWDDNLGVEFIYYNDGTSSQWVQTIPGGSGGGGGGTGTVTSINVTGSGGITSLGGPITSSGSIAVGLSVSGLSAVTPLVNSDLFLVERSGTNYKVTGSDLASYVAGVVGGGTVTSVDVSGGTTGLTFSGGPVTTTGTVTMAGVLGVANGGTGETTLAGIQALVEPNVVVTATSVTAASNDYIVITASGQTITLPASPAAGNNVTVVVAGTFLDTIVSGNGENIMGLAQDLTLDKEYAAMQFTYTDASNGWRLN